MANYNWKKDIADGERFEMEVCDLLNRNRHGDFVIKNENLKTRKYFDLYNNEHKWEVKLDKDSEKYGNVFFELFDGKGWKSGLLATWANYLIYGFPEGNTIRVVQSPYRDTMLFLMEIDCNIKVNSGDKKKTIGIVLERELYITSPFTLNIGTIKKWW